MDVPNSADYYADLGISPQANYLEIRSAYKRLVLLSHPDKAPQGKNIGGHDFLKIQAAWKCLSNDNSRKEYDLLRSAHRRHSQTPRYGEADRDFERRQAEMQAQDRERRAAEKIERHHAEQEAATRERRRREARVTAEVHRRRKAMERRQMEEREKKQKEDEEKGNTFILEAKKAAQETEDHERARQERARQERARQERARQERARQERARQAEQRSANDRRQKQTQEQARKRWNETAKRKMPWPKTESSDHPNNNGGSIANLDKHLSELNRIPYAMQRERHHREHGRPHQTSGQARKKSRRYAEKDQPNDARRKKGKRETPERQLPTPAECQALVRCVYGSWAHPTCGWKPECAEESCVFCGGTERGIFRCPFCNKAACPTCTKDRSLDAEQ